MPIHGEYKMLKAHAKVAKDCGLTDDRIHLPEKGEVSRIEKWP